MCLAIVFAQPLSMSSLAYLLVWSPPPHIPYISSPSQCLLFAAHAPTVATCFAVVSILDESDGEKAASPDSPGKQLLKLSWIIMYQINHVH